MESRDPSGAPPPPGSGDPPLRACWLHYGVADAPWDRGILSALRSLGVEVETLDVRAADLLSFFDEGTTSSRPPPDVVVNRVSDAQDPSLVKIANAFLRLCEECFGDDRVAIVNGARAYGVGTSKAVQSAMLRRLKLGQPETRMVRRSGGGCRRCLDDVRGAASDVGYPLLIKPNAGGFGAGIRRVDSAEQLERMLGRDDGQRSSVFDASNDDVILLQKFHAVGDFYRVWHLGGEIVCAARVTNAIANESAFGGAGDGSSERIDFNSCACSKSRAFTVIDPASMPGLREDVEAITNSCGADMGSIEFLVDTNLHDNGEGEGERLFFDINMLSTLPSPDRLGFNDEETRSKYQEEVSNLCEKTAAYIRQRALDSEPKNFSFRSSSPAANARRSDIHRVALD